MGKFVIYNSHDLPELSNIQILPQPGRIVSLGSSGAI